ncbi:hypothetical protein B0H21DRAFT_824292 [Amylocystis lapponica]|nr:hypothetical protein B0H21DRAFT_824292 [Amylocystis lapponica]
MSVFVRAFPNVQMLQLRDILPYDDGPQFSNLWEPLGKAELSVFESDIINDKKCWKSLDHAKGSIRDFIRWPINCPVHSLELSQTLGVADIDVIRAMLPVALQFEASRGVDGEFWSTLFQALPRIRYLNVWLRKGAGGSEVCLWTEQLKKLLEVPLLCLRIRFDDGLVGRISGSLPSTSIVCPSGLPEDSARERLLEVISAGLPSLRYFAIAARYIPWSRERDVTEDSQFSWWRIRADGSGRVAEPISRDIGDRVTRYMQSREYDPMSSFNEALLSQYV